MFSIYYGSTLIHQLDEVTAITFCYLNDQKQAYIWAFMIKTNCSKVLWGQCTYRSISYIFTYRRNLLGWWMIYTLPLWTHSCKQRDNWHNLLVPDIAKSWRFVYVKVFEFHCIVVSSWAKSISIKTKLILWKR